MDALALVLTTLPPSEAEAFARAIVGRKLAACAHVLPQGKSIYWWKGAIETAGESQVLFKTLESLVPALMDAIRQSHSYENPEILALTAAQASALYSDWVKESLAPRSAPLPRPEAPASERNSP